MYKKKITNFVTYNFSSYTALELFQSVGFNGNGYLELPASYLRYDQMEIEPELIALAFHTYNDGVLLYQKEAQLLRGGDYILLRGNFDKQL